jgi:hypothetical protein
MTVIKSGQEPIERDNETCSTVHCRLDHHLIVSVPEHGPPEEVQSDPARHLYEAVQNLANFGAGETARRQLLRPCKNCLILQHQRNRDYKLETAVQSSLNAAPRCTLIAP